MSKPEQESIHPDEIDQRELEDFKTKVSKWCEIDNKIRQFEQVVKAHKKQKEEFCADILKFMEGYEISNVKTAFGKLQKVENETKVPVTKALIEDKVKSYFAKIGLKNSKEQSELLVEDLYENREKKKVVRLKRVVPREKKDKKSTVPDGLKKI